MSALAMLSISPPSPCNLISPNLCLILTSLLKCQVDVSYCLLLCLPVRSPVNSGWRSGVSLWRRPWRTRRDRSSSSSSWSQSSAQKTCGEHRRCFSNHLQPSYVLVFFCQWMETFTFAVVNMLRSREGEKSCGACWWSILHFGCISKEKFLLLWTKSSCWHVVLCKSEAVQQHLLCIFSCDIVRRV